MSTFRLADTVLFQANLQYTIAELPSVIGNDFRGVLVCDRSEHIDGDVVGQAVKLEDTDAAIAGFAGLAIILNRR